MHALYSRRFSAALGYSYNMRFTSGRVEYLASFHGFPSQYGKLWRVGTIVPADDFIGALKKTALHGALFSLAIMAAAIVFVVVAAHRILGPLVLISQDMSRIQHLDIDETVRHGSFFYEIDMIATALASMKHGLKAFSKFVPVTLVKQLIASKTGAELGGEKRRLTIMFTDIEGFTSISERMPTEALLQHVSEYLDNLTTIILGHEGTVDKYIGDAIMCFWGAPSPVPDQEQQACRTALLCIKRLETLNASWRMEGKPPLRTRFGINTGEVSVGNMGSRDRMNYTVLGDAANLASRLESINKHYGTRVIVGEETHDAVAGRFVSRPIDVVAVKGKTRGVRIYELLSGLPEDPENRAVARGLAAPGAHRASVLRVHRSRLRDGRVAVRRARQGVPEGADWRDVRPALRGLCEEAARSRLVGGHVLDGEVGQRGRDAPTCHPNGRSKSRDLRRRGPRAFSHATRSGWCQAGGDGPLT